MSVKPFWQTPVGSLGTFVTGEIIIPINLEASNTSTIEIISGTLPPGLKLNSDNKTISGTPLDTGLDRPYEFVLRASNTTGVNGSKISQDRTFSISIDSTSRPVLLDPSGTLKLVSQKENYVLNKSTISYQFNATATAVPDGQSLKFYIEEGSGELPPGLKLTQSGLLYGTIEDDLELEYRVVQGSYDKDFYDINPYDYGSAIETARATTVIANGKVVDTNIVYGGNGYLLDPEVIIGGSVDNVIITNPGDLYSSAPEVVFSNSPVAGGITARGVANMLPIFSVSSIQTVLIDGAYSLDSSSSDLEGGNATTVYMINDQYFDGGPGDITLSQLLCYQVDSITITEPGTGYTSPPTISFKNQNTGNGASARCTLRPGSGAEFVAHVSNGTLNEIEILSQGSGYIQAPLLSFGLPTAGSRIISKTYKFAITVSNGAEFDTKQYSILVKSEDSMRVDTTFILSDTSEFDASKTYVQSPLWISPAQLPHIKGNNNIIYDLEVFDPTPSVGKVYFSLMDVNFDGTESSLGPADTIKNSVLYNITHIDLTSPVIITFAQSRLFVDGDRIKLENIGGTTQLENGIYYVKKTSDFTYELYSDKILINPIDGTLFNPFSGSGTAHFQNTFLELDPVGGEINGFIPYQPVVTKSYFFTVKAARIVDDIEVASVFKQFEIVIDGNIDGKIAYITPSNVGTLKPNEVCLLEVEATSTLASASVNYQLIPGYGRTSVLNYVELDLSEQRGEIFVDGYGINPVLILEKGQTYKINLATPNFTVSLRSVDGTYYNTGLRHSTGAVGTSAQEKSTGYFIFSPAFDQTDYVELVYTNTKKDGLFLSLKKYDINLRKWIKQDIQSYFTEYDAYVNNYTSISAGYDTFAILLNYTKLQFEIKKYNDSTLIWQTQNITTVEPLNPTDGTYWLDLDNSNFGLMQFRYVGLAGVWASVKPTVVTTMPSNSDGVNRDYFVLNDSGIFKILRKINVSWKVLERLTSTAKGAYDPNVFFAPHTATAPVTNLQYDVWFKHSSLYNGNDKQVTVRLKSLDSLPTDLTVGLNGDIIGKINPNTGSTYKSYYVGNTLYLLNDVVTFNNSFYICTNQYRSSGNWYQDILNWTPFSYTKRTTTSIDVNSYGIGRFSIAGVVGTDGTSIDKLLRFRVRAKDTQNVGYVDKDFTITYEASSNTTLTNVFLQPFLNKTNRENYFNFITNPITFPVESLYRSEDGSFGLQRVPKMLLLGGIESTLAERYASAVQRNYYDRPLYFGDLKLAIAKNNDVVEYEIVYVEINDPYEIGDVSVVESIKLGFDFDPLTADYTKIRMDTTTIDTAENGLDTIYPSSITLMQKGLEQVTLQKDESVLLTPEYDDYGRIPELQLSGPNQGQYIDVDPVDPTMNDDWGLVAERVALVDDFLSKIQTLTKDSKYRPLWMNTSQDGTGNPIGYTKAVPICYVKAGKGAEILKLIEKSGFDFKTLNFTIDRIIIQNPQGETGDKYIKFINREII